MATQELKTTISEIKIKSAFRGNVSVKLKIGK